MKKISHELFIGIFPTGIGYADAGVEEDGDYKRVAFLPFRSLVLEVSSPNSPLLSEIQRHANAIIARKGERYVVSGSGQTVLLGAK